MGGWWRISGLPDGCHFSLSIWDRVCSVHYLCLYISHSVRACMNLWRSYYNTWLNHNHVFSRLTARIQQCAVYRLLYPDLKKLTSINVSSSCIHVFTHRRRILRRKATKQCVSWRTATAYFLFVDLSRTSEFPDATFLLHACLASSSAIHRSQKIMSCRGLVATRAPRMREVRSSSLRSASNFCVSSFRRISMSQSHFRARFKIWEWKVLEWNRLTRRL